jgi:hypothetical protein
MSCLGCLLEPGRDIDVARIREMQDLIQALGRFWGRIEVDTDPELAGQVDYDGIFSGVPLVMGILVAAAEQETTKP